MRPRPALGLFVISLAACGAGSTTIADTGRPLAISEQFRREAIKDAFGVACAAKDADTARANAWASAAMGTVIALRENSKEAASDFAGVFYSTETWAHTNGGYNCEGFPKWPNREAP